MFEAGTNVSYSSVPVVLALVDALCTVQIHGKGNCAECGYIASTEDGCRNPSNVYRAIAQII